MISRIETGELALCVGAIGMILCNDMDVDYILARPHVLPTSHIKYDDFQTVMHYNNASNDLLGFITAPTAKMNLKPAPYKASFSSKGPNSITPEILKPDITAPGVGIIAAFTEAVSPIGEDFDMRRFPFNTDTGTSMSCPHVSGVVGFLKTLHPDLISSAIRSTIMTTVRTRGNTRNPSLYDERWNTWFSSEFAKATPFSYGSGHIRPNRAMDPGLVYDLTINDYLDFLYSIGFLSLSHIIQFSGLELPFNFSP